MSGFASFILSRGALKIAKSENEYFKLKSGRLSPVFFNAGSLIDGEALHILANAYADKIAELLKSGKLPSFDYVFGPAYKGIPLGAITCAALFSRYNITKKFLYDRKEAKEHGDVKADSIIVGANQFSHGGRILMIDDVITTGGAKLQAWEKIAKVLHSPKLVGIIVAVDRQECGGDAEKKTSGAGEEIKKQLGCALFSILTMGEIYSALAPALPAPDSASWRKYFAKWGTKEAQVWAGK